jgi:ankyrin repeat protein
MASEWGRIELVQRLLEAGIPPTDALPKASAGGYLDVVRLWLDAGVDPNETMGHRSPLASAIAKEHTAMFTLLVERGADLHADGVAEECVRRARKGGLDSMLLLSRRTVSTVKQATCIYSTSTLQEKPARKTDHRGEVE